MPRAAPKRLCECLVWRRGLEADLVADLTIRAAACHPHAHPWWELRYPVRAFGNSWISQWPNAHATQLLAWAARACCVDEVQTRKSTHKKWRHLQLSADGAALDRLVLRACWTVLMRFLQSHSDGESQRSNMEREETRSSPSTPSTPSVCSPTSTASSVPSTGKNLCASCGLEILDRYLLKVRRWQERTFMFTLS